MHCSERRKTATSPKYWKPHSWQRWESKHTLLSFHRTLLLRITLTSRRWSHSLVKKWSTPYGPHSHTQEQESTFCCSTCLSFPACVSLVKRACTVSQVWNSTSSERLWKQLYHHSSHVELSSYKVPKLRKTGSVSTYHQEEKLSNQPFAKSD